MLLNANNHHILAIYVTNILAHIITVQEFSKNKAPFTGQNIQL